MGVAITTGTVGVTGDVTIDTININNRPIIVGTVSGIGVNTLTTVATLPANGIKFISKIFCSGEENGRWEVYIDSVLKATARTIDRQVNFDFNIPLKILATEVVDVKVTHFGPGTTSDFDSTIFGYAL